MDRKYQYWHRWERDVNGLGVKNKRDVSNVIKNFAHYHRRWAEVLVYKNCVQTAAPRMTLNLPRTAKYGG